MQRKETAWLAEVGEVWDRPESGGASRVTLDAPHHRPDSQPPWSLGHPSSLVFTSPPFLLIPPLFPSPSLTSSLSLLLSHHSPHIPHLSTLSYSLSLSFSLLPFPLLPSSFPTSSLPLSLPPPSPVLTHSS